MEAGFKLDERGARLFAAIPLTAEVPLSWAQ
jgi:hypothetical protein